MLRAVRIANLVIGLLVPLLIAQTALADRAIGLGKPAESWSFATSVSRTNSLYVGDQEKDSSSWDYTFAPAFILSKDYTLSALVEASQDINSGDSDFGRGLLILKKSSGYQIFAKRTKVVPFVRLGLPISRWAQKESLQVATSIGSRFLANPNYLISKKLGLLVDFSLTKNFHTYKSAEDEKVNAAYASFQASEISWSFRDWLTLTGNFSHYNVFTYDNEQLDYWSHCEELEFKVNPRAAFAIGHAWGNPFVQTRKGDGEEINFELQDEENSLMYVQMSYVF